MLFMNGRGKWAGNSWVTHRWELPIIERRKAKGVHSRLSGKGYVPLILQFWPGLEALFLCRRRGLSFARGVWHLLYDVWDVLSTFAVPLYEHITGVSLSVLELEPLGCCSFYNVLNIAFISKLFRKDIHAGKRCCGAITRVLIWFASLIDEMQCLRMLIYKSLVLWMISVRSWGVHYSKDWLYFWSACNFF